MSKLLRLILIVVSSLVVPVSTFAQGAQWQRQGEDHRETHRESHAQYARPGFSGNFGRSSVGNVLTQAWFGSSFSGYLSGYNHIFGVGDVRACRDQGIIFEDRYDLVMQTNQDRIFTDRDLDPDQWCSLKPSARGYIDIQGEVLVKVALGMSLESTLGEVGKAMGSFGETPQGSQGINEFLVRAPMNLRVLSLENLESSGGDIFRVRGDGAVEALLPINVTVCGEPLAMTGKVVAAPLDEVVDEADSNQYIITAIYFDTINRGELDFEDVDTYKTLEEHRELRDGYFADNTLIKTVLGNSSCWRDPSLNNPTALSGARMLAGTHTTEAIINSDAVSFNLERVYLSKPVNQRYGYYTERLTPIILSRTKETINPFAIDGNVKCEGLFCVAFMGNIVRTGTFSGSCSG